ncbi:MAG: hypothetical protein KJ804_18950 [Proteobacteria bacterium]|nr:hypothetical protein [Pseudomonadota bacterium]MBU1060388.1 hypothetical protein [Pseudomonadota bacterium]
MELLIPAGSISRYTTLLQAGIIEERQSPCTYRAFFSSLPGVNSQYIVDRIETIFHNGLPVDDIETDIEGSAPVIAISGAMPGLAGAIFRKNSFHAALRTAESHASSDSLEKAEKKIITLKLFNVIASEKGGNFLNNGCFMKSDSVLKFINYRPQLFSHLLALSCDDNSLELEEVKTILLHSDIVFLKIHEDDGRLS